MRAWGTGCSNTVTLLYLLQKNIKPASGGTYTSRVRSPGSTRYFRLLLKAFRDFERT